MDGFSLASFDIECSDLDSRWARGLTAGVKPYHRKPEMLINPALKRPLGKRSSDRDFYVELRRQLEQYDVLVSYYGGPKRFDLPMINSRLLFYGERILAPRFHIDMYPVVKNNLRLKYRRLEDVGQLLHVPGKTKINPDDWVGAAWDGDSEAIKRILEHNYYDVIVLEKVFDKLRDFINVVRRH